MSNEYDSIDNKEKILRKMIKQSKELDELKRKFDQWIMETFDITHEEFIKLIFEDE